MKVVVEDSIYNFRIITLSEYAEIIIPNSIKPWARGGHFRTVKLRKAGQAKFEEVNMNEEDVERYQLCLRNNIPPDDYDIYLRVEQLLKRS